MPKLYQGKRGGTFYRKKGKKIYITNRFGDEQSIVNSIVNSIIFYIKFHNPVLLYKIFVLDTQYSTITEDEYNMIFINAIQPFLSQDYTKHDKSYNELEESKKLYIIPTIQKLKNGKLMGTYKKLDISKIDQNRELANQQLIQKFIQDIQQIISNRSTDQTKEEYQQYIQQFIQSTIQEYNQNVIKNSYITSSSPYANDIHNLHLVTKGTPTETINVQPYIILNLIDVLYNRFLQYISTHEFSVLKNQAELEEFHKLSQVQQVPKGDLTPDQDLFYTNVDWLYYYIGKQIGYDIQKIFDEFIPFLLEGRQIDENFRGLILDHIHYLEYEISIKFLDIINKKLKKPLPIEVTELLYGRFHQERQERNFNLYCLSVQKEYDILLKTCKKLKGAYDKLQAEHTTLQQKYNKLDQKYKRLQKKTKPEPSLFPKK